MAHTAQAATPEGLVRFKDRWKSDSLGRETNVYFVCCLGFALIDLVRGSSFDAAHHVHEFFEVNLAVAVLINLVDCGVQLLLGVDVLHFLTLEKGLELRGIDLAAVVNVEHAEGGLEVILAQECLSIHRGGNELC